MRNSQFISLVILAVVLFVGMQGTASADIINSASDPSLNGGTIIDFDTTTAGSYSSVTIGNTTFTAGQGTTEIVGGGFIGEYNTRGVNSLYNTQAGDAFSALTFQFSNPVNAFGFLWGGADDIWTLSAFDVNNVLLESRQLPATRASNAGDFFGLSVSGIDHATLVDPLGTGDYVFIDNFTSAQTTPEPSTLALLGIAAFGLLGYLRRRRRCVA